MGLAVPAGVKIAERNIPGPDGFLTEAEVKALTPAKVIANVRALVPYIKKHRLDSELRRMPVDAVWDAIRKTGYFYLIVPKKWGGLEASFDDMLDATFALCEADPSIGWLAAFSVMNPRSAAAFSEKALLEMFGDGKTFGHGKYTVLNTLFAPFGEAERVEGGWRISGIWHWGTTVQMADWADVMCWYTKEDGTRTLGTFLFPASELKILDTWTADGLVATGTHKVLVDNVFVPDYRTVPFIMTAPEWIEHIRSRFEYPIFRANLRNALSTTIAVPCVGIAMGAVKRYAELLQEWTKRGDEGREADKQTSQIRLAHVHAKVKACEIQLRDIARRTYELANEPEDVQTRFAEEVSCEIAYCAHMARDAVLEISKGLGTSAHYIEEAMSQYVRDIMVGSTHVAVNWDRLMTTSGRSLLGLPPEAPKAGARIA